MGRRLPQAEGNRLCGRAANPQFADRTRARSAAGHARLSNLVRGAAWKILEDRKLKPHKVTCHPEQRDSEFGRKKDRGLETYRRADIQRGERRRRAGHAPTGSTGAGAATNSSKSSSDLTMRNRRAGASIRFPATVPRMLPGHAGLAGGRTGSNLSSSRRPRAAVQRNTRAKQRRCMLRDAGTASEPLPEISGCATSRKLPSEAGNGFRPSPPRPANLSLFLRCIALSAFPDKCCTRPFSKQHPAPGRCLRSSRG